MSSIEERKKTIEANQKLIDDTLAKLNASRERFEAPLRAAGIDPEDVKAFMGKERIPAHIQEHADRAIEMDRVDLEERRRQGREAMRAEQGKAHHKPRHQHDMI